MPGPILWGPNNTSNNLQNQILNPAGSLLAYNGQKNYISNASFENQLTTGYSLGTTGTLTNGIPTGSPTFGSGASGNLSLAIETSGPIAGLASLGYVSSAATTAGNMVASDAFTIDIEDQAQRLSFSVAYLAKTNPGNANWSGTSSNSFAFAIYDVTNSAYIIPTGVFNFIQSTGVGKCTGSFQTSSNGTSYRIIIYNANATSGAITLYFDDIFLGPSPIASQSSVVSWNGSQTSQAVTANVTDIAFTTVKDSSAAWNGTQYVVATAGDYAVMGSAIASIITSLQVYRNGSIFTNGFFATSNAGGVSGGAILVTNCKPGDTISLRANTSPTLTSGSLGIFLIGSQPGAGAGGVVAAELNTASSTTVTANTAITFTTLGFDTSGSVSSLNKFTAPTTGVYLISVYNDAGSGGTRAYAAKNGSFSATSANTITASSSSISAGGAILMQLNAGDFVQLAYNTSFTINSTGVNFNICLIQGTPAAASSSASVNARYFASATSISGSLATVVWTTKDFDTASGMVSGVYTIPTTGKYQVNTALAVNGTLALNSALNLQLQKNGTVVSEQNVFSGGIETGFVSDVSDIISCIAGDTVRVQVSTTATGPSIVSSNSKNYFSIALVGQ